MIAFNAGLTGLSLNTLSEGRDAVVVVGDPDSGNAIVVSSSSNTITDAVPGLTLNLLGTSDEPVEVTVSADIESTVADVQAFVESFNEAMDRISELTSYDAETEERGILLGDHAVNRVRDRLFRTLLSSVEHPDLTYDSLFDVGLRVGSGNHLEFDQARFESAMEEDPEGVRKLFTLLEKDEDEDTTIRIGLATRLDQVFDELTNSIDGLLAQQDDKIQSQVDQYNRRADDMQELLDMKEARLFAQFQAMENSLAALQSQQAALQSLSSMASSLGSSGGGIGLGL
jgi:flagellar hook-associated protein 2